MSTNKPKAAKATKLAIADRINGKTVAGALEGIGACQESQDMAGKSVQRAGPAREFGAG